MDIATNSEFWKKELSGFSENCDFELLNKRLDDVYNAAPMAEFSEEQLAEINNTLKWLRSDSKLLALWGAFYDTLYGAKMYEAIVADPRLDEAGMKEAGAFYLTLVIAGIRYGEKLFKSKKWPIALYYDILPDIKVWTDDYMNNHGAFGIHWKMAVPWLIKHHTGQVLQFGRLQCNSTFNFYNDILVLKNHKDGSFCALLNGEHDFNSKGLVALADDAVAFRSMKIEGAYGKLTANTVSPLGVVSAKPVTLDLNHWNFVLNPFDHVVNLHIPAIGPLKSEQCDESVKRMLEFFEKYSPEFKPKAFVCDSWLLDPELHHLLPQNSNLLAFQKAGYLLPSFSESDAVRRVFGAKALLHGIDSVPHVSGLQKRLAAFVRNGGHFRPGRFFLLVDDLPWGNNPYIK